MTTSDKPLVDSLAPWAERWAAGNTAWDQGGPHPLIPVLLREAREENLLPNGCAILEPGCGRAHSGAYLAQLGYQVTAFDGVEAAVAAARSLYGQQANLELRVQDALSPLLAWKEAFQAIYDRAVLCALPPELRRLYVQACFFHLAPGGVLLSIPFTDCSGGPTEGPPFMLPLPAMAALLMPYFSLIFAEEHTLPASTSRVRKEAISIWRRRDRRLVESD